MGTEYAEAYRGVDFRAHPELYPIGRGEQGVLMAEPYKSELLPLWRFRTEAIAEESSQALLARFYSYLAEEDFVGADMARKFLQMGWTRARRYANHASGRKYEEGKTRPQAADALTNEKARAAAVFKRCYDEARLNESYKILASAHRERQRRAKEN